MNNIINISDIRNTMQSSLYLENAHIMHDKHPNSETNNFNSYKHLDRPGKKPVNITDAQSTPLLA